MRNWLITAQAKLWPLIVAGLFFGSSGSRAAATNELYGPVAILGFGIRNEIELGMTLDQAQRRCPDLVITTNRLGEGRAATATSYSGSMPTRGLEVQVVGRGDPVSAITLRVDPALATNRFEGRLSCGFSFSGGKSVGRDEVVRVLGQPQSLRGTNLLPQLQAGQDVAWRPNSATEVLYYPAKGVICRLRNGIVDVITIILAYREPAKQPE